MFSVLRHPVHALPRLSRSIAAVASEVPKVAPFDKIPFKAPPVDETRGQLGQVYLPDTALPVYEIQEIPTEPDNYTLYTPSIDNFPSFHAPEVLTVASPSTHPGGAPSHGSTSGGDDVIFGNLGELAPALAKDKDVSVKPIPFEPVDRPLNPEEKKGLLGLGGIVVGGFLLGGLAKPGKAKAVKAAAKKA